MDPSTFQTLLERRIGLIKSILGAKVAAAFNDTTPEQANWFLNTKHLVSIRDMVLSGKDYPMAAWDEKIGDAINYLILLEGLVQERINEGIVGG